MHESTREPGRDEPGAMEELARDPSSRKRFLKMAGGAGAASAFAAFLAACGGNDGGGGGGGGKQTSTAEPSPAGGGANASREPNADPRQGTSDVDILNYALRLEYLDTAFYAAAIESGLFRGRERVMLQRFRENEQAHLKTVRSTIEKLGGRPVARLETKFPMGSRLSVLRLASKLENGGAAAYLGQANRIRSKEVLAAALSIHSVEARHAATVDGLLGLPPAPQGSFALPLTMEEVLGETQRFVAS